MAKDNSPFGAWVVCVYRIEAVDSPALVNATICAFFVFIQILAKFLVEQGRNSLGFNPTSEDCMKHLNRIAAAVAVIATTFLFSACGGESFTDPRDGQKYKTVKIGDQVWMAEKLKYKGNDSYSWDEALVACPEGWRLPSKEELEGVVSDTSIDYTWSSTEKEDFSLKAYILDEKKINIAFKDLDRWNPYVRCLQGVGSKQPIFSEHKGYKALRVGKQIWMSDHLTVNSPNSICYLDDSEECSKGRYYPFSEALNICPEDWHLPSKSEAIKFVNTLKKENSSIKSTRGYYISETGNFEETWGDVMLWTSSKGFLIKQRRNDLEIADYSWSRDWKVAVRCIADVEDKKEE